MADDNCDAYRKTIANIDEEIARLEALIPEYEAEGINTGPIRAQIKSLGSQRFYLLRELEQCERSVNVAMIGVESTQVIQYFNGLLGQSSGLGGTNAVPLVAEKTTLLRAFVNATTSPGRFPPPNSFDGTASFSGPRGTLTLKSINGPISARTLPSIQRSQIDHSVNFVLPAAFCSGTVSGGVRIFDPGQQQDNVFIHFILSFDTVPQVRIHGVLIHYTGKDLRGNPTDIAAPSRSDLVNTLVWVGKTYPINGFNYTAYDVITFNGDLTVSSGGGCGGGWNQLINTIRNMQSASGSSDIYVGLLPAGVPNGGVSG